MAKDAFYFGAAMVQRIARAVRWVERQMRRRDKSKKPRTRKGHGFIEIGFAEMNEAIDPGDSGAATLLIQNDETGGWALSEDEADIVTLQLHASATGGIPDECIVVFARNPKNGIRNIIQSFCCPE